MRRLPILPTVGLCVALLLSITLPAASADERDAGPLDHPLALPGGNARSTATTLPPAVDARNNPIKSQAQLRAAVEDEQEQLERLPREQLVLRAEHGERAAQVVLGSEFAREATGLSFAPAAANEALSDAVRWYSLAASRGFPGAPSLDQAGIHFFPIRIQREQHR